MSTRKIADLPKVNKCRHPEHKPPAYMVYSPGVYEHVCPGCGEVTHFTINEEPSL